MDWHRRARRKDFRQLAGTIRGKVDNDDEGYSQIDADLAEEMLQRGHAASRRSNRA